MKKLFRPQSLLMYLLTILVFAIIGLPYAGFIDAGKNQGLAGGAIVMSYGIMFAAGAWVIAMILAYKLNEKTITNINIGLAIALLVLIFLVRFMNPRQPQSSNHLIAPPTQ